MLIYQRAICFGSVDLAIWVAVFRVETSQHPAVAGHVPVKGLGFCTF